MSDYISRQAAIDVADKFSDADGCNGSDVAMDIISGLISLPSVQPDVVRCKDCMVLQICRFAQGLGLNGYCSQGERRTDG